jgi:8-amino-7-oxononanoate synthase
VGRSAYVFDPVLQPAFLARPQPSSSALAQCNGQWQIRKGLGVKTDPDLKLRKALEKQADRGNLRSLSPPGDGVDFYSNDYLGLSRSGELARRIQLVLAQQEQLPLGSTGSRLISGNSNLAEDLERQLANFHRAHAGLLFSSGYAANSGLFAAIAGLGDTLVMDELIHASAVDGARLSKASRQVFPHNDPGELASKLQSARAASPDGAIFVGIESLYSMNGDFAPLAEMAAVCQQYDASLIVDEAHSNGLTGPHGAGSVVAMGLEDSIFARVHTFGKGLGLHGAVVLGSRTLRDYLINFCRPFIFSTAPPADSLLRIRAAYDLLPELDATRERLSFLVRKFRTLTASSSGQWLDSSSWIQSLVVPGNRQVLAAAAGLQDQGFCVKAIRAPSVRSGSERIRICLHAFNTEREIEDLFTALENSACTAISLQA